MNNNDERDYAEEAANRREMESESDEIETTLLRVEIQRHPDGTVALVVRDAEPETIGDVNKLAFPAVIGGMPNVSSLADARDKVLNALNYITGPEVNRPYLRVDEESYVVLLNCDHWVLTKQPDDFRTFACPMGHGEQEVARDSQTGTRAILAMWEYWGPEN